MYPFYMYARMHADQERLHAFSTAMSNLIRPGDTVLELGCGPGLFSLMAVKHGAAHVYALDPSPFVELARRAAKANDLDERVEVCRRLSTDWTPSRRIDIVLHDLRGTLPIFGRSLHSLRDLRKRIAPTAVMIPRRDDLRAALVSCEELRSDVIDVWSHCDDRVEAGAYTDLAINSAYTTQIKPHMIVSDVHLLGALDYEDDLPQDIELSTTWTISTSRTVDGVGMWFDSQYADGLKYTSGPDNPKSVYGQLYLPLRESLTLPETTRVYWRVNAMDTGTGYFWWWSTRVQLPSGVVIHSRQGEVNVRRLEEETSGPTSRQPDRG